MPDPTTPVADDDLRDRTCVFCDIVAGDAPATIVREWPDAVAFVPRDPVVDGHVLVVPRRHVADATSRPDVTADTMRRAAELAAGLCWLYDTEHSNILTSVGAPATQSIFHLHIHVIPRRTGDQLMVPWGTTGNPHEPHRCKGMDALDAEIAQIVVERDNARADLDDLRARIASKTATSNLPASPTPGSNDLRDQIADILVQRHTSGLCPLNGPCEACDCFDPQHRQERDDADAIVALLAGLLDPGDLPKRMREAVLSHEWNPSLPNTAHERHSYSADCAICEGDVRRILEVAMSVRWENAAAVLAENAYLRRCEEHAVNGHQVTKERLAETRRKLELATNALADKHDGVRLWMLDCAKLTEEWREKATAAEAQVAAVRRAVVDTYGEDYDDEDVPAALERLFGHLGDYESDVRRLMQVKSEALESAQAQVAALQRDLEEARETIKLHEACAPATNNLAKQQRLRAEQAERELTELKTGVAEAVRQIRAWQDPDSTEPLLDHVHVPEVERTLKKYIGEHVIAALEARPDDPEEIRHLAEGERQ